MQPPDSADCGQHPLSHCDHSNHMTDVHPLSILLWYQFSRAFHIWKRCNTLEYTFIYWQSEEVISAYSQRNLREPIWLLTIYIPALFGLELLKISVWWETSRLVTITSPFSLSSFGEGQGCILTTGTRFRTSYSDTKVSWNYMFCQLKCLSRNFFSLPKVRWSLSAQIT